MPYKDVLKRKEHLKNYYLKNKDKILVRAKQNHIDNKDKHSAKHKEYYKKHRDEIKARMTEYSVANKDKISAKRKFHRAENKDSIRKQKHDSYLRNREKIIARQKEYHLKNKDKILVRQKDYRLKRRMSTNKKFSDYRNGAKERNLIFDISFDVFMSFWQKPCDYCGTTIPTIGIDRVDSSKGYIDGNIVPCCAMCNTMKLHYDIDSFLDQCLKITNHNK